MDFEYIVLTRKEYKRLKALSHAPSGLDAGPNESALINYKLIDRNHYGPSSTVSVISDRGKQYLLYRKQRRKEWWWNNGMSLLNTFLALIAAAASIIALLQ